MGKPSNPTQAIVALGVAIAPNAVVTSDRRWRTLGILRTTLANQAMIVGYFLGIDPQKLARWYRNLGKPRQ